MEDKNFNGWSNYETWCVCLWLDSDEGTYRYWREQAHQCRKLARHSHQFKQEVWTREEAERFLLADQLKEEIQEASPLENASVYSDLLNAAISEVNWHEIAASILVELATCK